MSTKNGFSRYSKVRDFTHTVQKTLGNLTTTDEDRGTNLRDLAKALSSATIFCPDELDKVRESCEAFALMIVETAAKNSGNGSNKLGLSEGQIFFLQMVHADDSGVERYVRGLESIVSRPTRTALRPIWKQVRPYSNFRFLTDKDSDEAQRHNYQDNSPFRPITTRPQSVSDKRVIKFKRDEFPCAF